MAEGEIHVGDIGTVFRVEVKNASGAVVDISSATSKTISFQKPDGTDVTQTASFTTDGTDGLLQYATLAGDLDQTKLWSYQAKVVLAAGEWNSSVIHFDVFPNVVSTSTKEQTTYVSLIELKAYLGTTSNDQDELLYTFIKAASRRIDDYLGYTFEIEYGSDESLYNVKDLDIIVLRKYPIVGISSIESGVEYLRRDDEGIIILHSPFSGDFALSVTFGEEAPDTVKLVCMELCNLHNSKRQMQTGTKKMQMGDFSIEMQSGSSAQTEKQTQDILKTLDGYRDLHGSVTKQSYNQLGY
jgi:hypothetical protein